MLFLLLVFVRVRFLQLANETIVIKEKDSMNRWSTQTPYHEADLFVLKTL